MAFFLCFSELLLKNWSGFGLLSGCLQDVLGSFRWLRYCRIDKSCGLWNMSKPSCCRLMLPGWSNPMQFYLICKFSLLLERGESFLSSYLRRIWSVGLGAISGLLGIAGITTTFFERAD